MNLLNKFRYFVRKIIFFLFCRNQEVFYKKFYGSLNIWNLIFFTILFPGRSIIRMKCNRFLIPKNFSDIDSDIYIETKNKSKKEIEIESLKKLKKYGSIIINDYFDEETLQNFEKEHSDAFAEISKIPSNFTSRSKNLPLSKSLETLWFDESIIKILENYIKRKPLARNYPDITSFTPLNDYSESIKTDYAGVWHVDHATLIQAAIFFTDVKKDGTHMQTIAGSHTFPNLTINGPISGEYVNSKKFKIAQCTGKRGSVQIHCGNVYHRFFPGKNNTRTWLKFHYCSGTNILFDKKKMERLISKNQNLSILNNNGQKIIKGLVPKNTDKIDFDFNGYDIKNDVLTKSGDPHYYKDSPGNFLWKK
jgi:hypothetical protein